MPFSTTGALRVAIAAASLLLAARAGADMVLSQVIVDLVPGKPPRDDIEAINTGSERLYIVADPAEIQAPGTDAEHRVVNADPAVSGLLVTPQRMILEPGERKLIRIAAVGPRPLQDRVYRVTVKPVVGTVAAQTTALKVLIGYDALVIVRPAEPKSVITGTRLADRIVLTNAGNSSAEMYAGMQCRPNTTECLPLPAYRQYAGASHTVPIRPGYQVRYSAKIGDVVEQKTY